MRPLFYYLHHSNANILAHKSFYIVRKTMKCHCCWNVQLLGPDAALCLAPRTKKIKCYLFQLSYSITGPVSFLGWKGLNHKPGRYTGQTHCHFLISCWLVVVDLLSHVTILVLEPTLPSSTPPSALSFFKPSLLSCRCDELQVEINSDLLI